MSMRRSSRNWLSVLIVLIGCGFLLAWPEFWPLAFWTARVTILVITFGVFLGFLSLKWEGMDGIKKDWMG